MLKQPLAPGRSECPLDRFTFFGSSVKNRNFFFLNKSFMPVSIGQIEIQ